MRTPIARVLALALTAVLLGAPAASAAPISEPRWVRGVLLTEYFPVPEAWFVGKRVRAPGLPGKHRVDWLYGGKGLSMEGDGVGLDGRRYHIDDIGRSGWINADGKRTRPGRRGWSRGAPWWRAEGVWRTASGTPTFPLERGGWANGFGRRHVPANDITFAPGPSRPLRPYQSIAVDPDLIPLGSRVYIPAYRAFEPGRGWFTAQDVGGAIIGRHIDVFRPAPPRPGGGHVTRDQRVYVVPPVR